MIKLFEKYKDISDVKEEIFLRAVDTGNIEIVDSFIEKGYDINANNVLYRAGLADEELFKHLIEKGSDIEQVTLDYEFKELLKHDNIQKILMDLNYELFVEQTVGINRNLKSIPKYKDIIDMIEDAKKYNL
jgi:hypothetical protein